jgi:diaminopimelate epimerase
MKIPFWKMSGSGNDFVVIDNRRKRLKGSLAKWAERLCHRQFGIGADGLLLLEPSKKADFRMVYFNSDGSRASMCGNGARCMAWTAEQLKVVGPRFTFETDAGIVGGEVSGQVAKVTLSRPKGYKAEVVVPTPDQEYRVGFINTGVPHAVVFVDDAEKVEIAREGAAIRFHKVFQPAGTNVNFVQKINDRTLRVRTYERGVEGETLACGTGVSASALVATLRGLVRAPVRCIVSGGDTLEVNFDLHPENAEQPADRVTLKGPVRRTFVGEFQA